MTIFRLLNRARIGGSAQAWSLRASFQSLALFLAVGGASAWGQGGPNIDLTGTWIIHGTDRSNRRWFADLDIVQSPGSPDPILMGHFDWDTADDIAYGREKFDGTRRVIISGGADADIFDLTKHSFDIDGDLLENHHTRLRREVYFAIVSADGTRLLDGNWSGGVGSPSDDWMGVRADVTKTEFDAGLDGWTVVGNGTLAFENTSGDPGGRGLATELVGDSNIVLVSPAKFHGDWSWEGDVPGVISFDVKWESVPGINPTAPTVRISGPGGSAFRSDENPGSDWRTYVFGLEEKFGNQVLWTVEFGTWEALLADVTRFEIIADFSSGVDQAAFDNIRLLLPTEPSLRQITDRGMGPCLDPCCAIDHRHPILNPAGTQIGFSSMWNGDEISGNLNQEKNREIFRYEIDGDEMIQDTQTLEGHNLLYDFNDAGITFLSTSPELGSNVDKNADLFRIEAPSGSIEEQTDTISASVTNFHSDFDDTFDQTTLDPKWTWVTPLAGPTHSLTDSPGKLRMSVPSSGIFDSWTGVDDMPKLELQSQGAEWTFEATVSVQSFSQADGFQVGLYAQLGALDYFYFGPRSDAVVYLHRTGSNFSGFNANTTEVDLQIKRAADVDMYTFSFRPPGTQNWIAFRTLPGDGDAPQSVGLFIRSSQFVDVTVDFDDVHLSGAICALEWFEDADWQTLSNLHADASPDSRYLVWASNRDLDSGSDNSDMNYEIFWMDRVSGEVRQLTDTTGGDDVEDAWGANLWPRVDTTGRRVVFVSNRGLSGPASGPGKYGVYIFDAMTGTIERMTTAEIAVSRAFPAFGMDDTSQWITFASEADLIGENTDRNAEIFLVNSFIGQIQQVTVTADTTSNLDPILSGDGTKLAFRSDANLAGANGDGSEELWALDLSAPMVGDADFFRVTQQTDTPISGPGRHAWADWYSFDYVGSRLAFTARGDYVGQNAEHAYEIFLAEFGWSEPRKNGVGPDGWASYR